MSSSSSIRNKRLYLATLSLYTLFWGLNLQMIDVSQVKKIDDDVLNRQEQLQKQSASAQKSVKADKKQLVSDHQTATKSAGVFGKTRDLVKRLVDCCIE